MKKKIRLFRESLKLVWQSAPLWASVNVAVSLLRSFLPLALLFLIKILIDDITRATSEPGTVALSQIIWLIGAVVVVFFIDEVTNDYSGFIRKKQSFSLESHMFTLLHKKATSLDLINFENPSYFDCLARASREAPWRPDSILNNLVSMLRGGLSLILMAGLLVALNWWLAILLIAVNIPGVWLRLYYADVIYNFQKEQTPESRKAAYFNWLLTGDRPARELRLFGLGGYFMKLFRQSYDKHKSEEIDIVRRRTIIEVLSDIFKAAAFFVMLYFVAERTISGKITLGEMAMLILAFRQGMVNLKELFGSIALLYEDSLFIGDVFDFLKLSEGITAENPVVRHDKSDSSLTVEGISFSYPGSAVKVINNVSFKIGNGEIIAIAGPNGAGKSTLVRLLCRLYKPDSGHIKIGADNIRNMDPEELRKNFSVVFQDFMLYNLTAGENISIGNIDEPASPAEIETSARSSGLHDLISALPKGYDTPVGNLFDDSRELSWGEWQKIAFARALYRKASVLILDEPSSALDAETEYEIFRRLREIVKGRTCLLISHRFTNVKLADRIIVLNKGMIEETGTHDELIMKKGLYYNMYTKQNGRFDQDN
jgi:ATP-binding cassette subfamily B protein